MQVYGVNVKQVGKMCSGCKTCLVKHMVRMCDSSQGIGTCDILVYRCPTNMVTVINIKGSSATISGSPSSENRHHEEKTHVSRRGTFSITSRHISYNTLLEYVLLL